LVELLRQQTERHRNKVAFSFSRDGDDENGIQLTYRELDLNARAVAASLQRQGAVGERVLVLWRPGLDCLAAYFGCLYAGAVPVPVDEQWASRRVATVVPDARAGFALATPETRAKIKTTVDGLVDRESLRWCSTDVVVDEADNWVAPDVDADTPAMVQYTSGSTRTPRGIVLTHDNMLHNLRLIRQAWDPDLDDPLFNNPAGGVTGVFWLPHHHDMGLIGGVLAPIDAGFTVALMAPGAFLMRPMGWLKAMSRHRAVVSAAPNFAFDLCVKRSTPQQRAELDLSNWSIAITGGEPVRAETLRAFADAFAPAGFKPEAFLPAYGLAEATLGVSGVSDSPAPVVEHIDRTALEGDRVVAAEPDDDGAVALVGCGRPRGGQTVVIVDPETRRLRRDDEVGEVWISGPCVAAGYWARPDETEQTFEAFLAADPDGCPGQYSGPYLRTGDLGFFRFGEVFITGRCKDLVIIRAATITPTTSR
jgi:acyl-CoA synthetase (AMP-forming)/AMP-acid ligase II